MNRIDSLFKKLKAAEKKAFVAYICAGDPSLKQTKEIVLALEKAGADIVELGVPFSDPLADGVVNQLAAQRALEAGATPLGVLQTVADIRTQSQIPIVLYTYYNPLFHLGLENFLNQASQAGVDGILVLDLPPEESSREWPKTKKIQRIFLVAPTTPTGRMASVAQHGEGFIYYVSRTGITGMREDIAQDLSAQVAALRKHTSLPICVGFGISNPEQAAAVARTADGVVVGSAIVDQIAKNAHAPDIATKIQKNVHPLAEAVHGI
ncbi:MAG: tryptophan synthase subunit alpha [Verrucomicrobiota bacterium]